MEKTNNMNNNHKFIVKSLMGAVLIASGNLAQATQVSVDMTVDTNSYTVVPDRGALNVTLNNTLTIADANMLISEALGGGAASPLDATEVNNIIQLAWGTPDANTTDPQSSLTIISHRFDVTASTNFSTSTYADNYFGNFLTETEFGLIPTDGFGNPLLANTQFDNTTGFINGSYIPLARVIFHNSTTYGGELSSFDFTTTLNQFLLSQITDTLDVASVIINTDNNCDANADATCAYDDVTVSFPNDSGTTGIFDSDFSIAEGATASAILWGSIGSLHGYGWTSPSIFATTSITTTDGVTKTYYPDGTVTVVPSPAPLALLAIGLTLLGISMRKTKK